MNTYEFKATGLIAEAFEQHGVKFDVVNRSGSEHLCAGFYVDCGPNAVIRFISRDGDNDVAVRIFGLISRTPAKKRLRLLEACNILNRKIRYLKFYIDDEGGVNVEYDFPVHSPDGGVGEMAFEIFIRTMQILDLEYGIFMKALYTNEELSMWDRHIPTALRQTLQELLETMNHDGGADLGEDGEEEGAGSDAEAVEKSEASDDGAAC